MSNLLSNIEPTWTETATDDVPAISFKIQGDEFGWVEWLSYDEISGEVSIECTDSNLRTNYYGDLDVGNMHDELQAWLDNHKDEVIKYFGYGQQD